MPDPAGLSNYFYCQTCGFIFRKGHLSKRKLEKIVEHYQNDDPHAAVANSKQRFFELAIDYLSTRILTTCRSILDIGCGYGYFLDLAQKRGWETSGVEITAPAAIAARQRIGTEKIFLGQLNQATFPANSFNAVTLWDVLFVMENPAEELEECYRLLKPGGVIGLRVRNTLFKKFCYYIYRPFRRIATKLGIKNPSVFHPFCFSPKSLELLLSRLGFKNIQISNSPLTIGDPYGYIAISGMVSILKRLIGLISKVVFLLSKKKLIVGPSLLVWAEKPEKE